MKAIIFERVGQLLAVQTLPDPTPQADEVIIRVSHCGVCGTDLHATSGHGRVLARGAQLGHEFAGEVVAVGLDTSRIKIGDRVAGIPAVGCGNCEFCRTGLDILCKNFVSYGKALAEYVRLPERGAIVLPATVSLADGALIEPLAVALRGVRLARPSPENRALVIGPGPIGLGVHFWLRRLGIRHVAVLSSSDRRRSLAQARGVEHFIVDSAEAGHSIVEALGGLPDLIFEAAGVPGVIARSIQLIRPQGMIIALGFCTQAESIVPAAALMKDVTIRFSLTYTREDYGMCADALAHAADQVHALVTETVSLEQFPAAFEAFRSGRTGGGKLLCAPWADAAG